MRESPELRELSMELLKAATSGDEAALLRVVSHEPGVLLIGTAPEEWHAGYEAVAKALSGAHEDYDTSGGILAEAEVFAYEAGAVGWAACRGSVVFAGQAPIPLRLTLVCQRAAEREASDWCVVQWHVSIGVPNADAFHETVVIQAG
jgi:hypothetical protein